MIQPGFYRVSDKDYHEGEGVSKSDLSLILRSPAHFRAKEERKETPALILGSAIHVAVFQPDEFSKRYAVKPEFMSFSTTLGKAWRDNHQGKVILSWDDAATCEGIRKAVRAHPIAADLLSDGEAEITGYFRDSEYPEILQKLRIDWLNKKQGVLIDLKSTEDARLFPFMRDAYKHDYTLQSAHYLFGISQITRITHEKFIFIAAEKAPPFAVQIYEATPDFITAGLLQRAKALAIYNECMKKNQWPAYSMEVLPLDVPAWAKKKEENVIFG